MYIHVCNVYICIHIYVYIYICIYTHTHTSTHTHTHPGSGMQHLMATSRIESVCAASNIFLGQVCVCVRVCVCVFMCVYIHIIHICKYVYYIFI